MDQNKNQNRSIDKVQNMGKERSEICKDSRQDSGHSKFSQARYAEKFFTQIYRDLNGDAMLVPIRMGTNMNMNMNCSDSQIFRSKSFVNQCDGSLSRHVNAASPKSLQI